MATQIGTLGTIPTITVGGRLFTDISNLIILTERVLTAARFSTLRKPNSSAGYQVTAGKTLTIEAQQSISSASSASQYEYFLLYGDTDVGQDSAAAPTTPIYVAGEATNTITAGHYEQAASETYVMPVNLITRFQVPAAKYAAFKATSAGTVLWAYGYET